MTSDMTESQSGESHDCTDTGCTSESCYQSYCAAEQAPLRYYEWVEQVSDYERD